MKTLVSIFFIVGILASFAQASTTINPVNKFAYGANLGWMDWRGADFVFGIGRRICS
jgi:hypothetical protein